MLSIAYVSVTTAPITDEEITALLLKCRSNNHRDGITGALLYHQNRFIQIVEGPDDIVLARFALIAEDSRHSNVSVMREVPIARRQFPDWTMGFRSPSEGSAEELEGFEDFFARTGLDRVRHAENEAQQFLEWLKEYWLARA